jgi:nucleoside-triphosphatase THEP1
MDKRHIVISGQRGVGKSTLIEKLLREIEVPVRGFFHAEHAKERRGVSLDLYIQTNRPGTKDESRQPHRRLRRSQ